MSSSLIFINSYLHFCGPCFPPFCSLPDTVNPSLKIFKMVENLAVCYYTVNALEDKELCKTCENLVLVALFIGDLEHLVLQTAQRL